MQGTGPFTVFVDANVWFSRTLRDWIGMLYTTPDTPSFVVHWSEDVLAELIHHLRKRHPTWPGGRVTEDSATVSRERSKPAGSTSTRSTRRTAGATPATRMCTRQHWPAEQTLS